MPADIVLDTNAIKLTEGQTTIDETLLVNGGTGNLVVLVGEQGINIYDPRRQPSCGDRQLRKRDVCVPSKPGESNPGLNQRYWNTSEFEYQGICVLDVAQHPEITVPGQLHWICLNNDIGGNDNIIVAHQGVIDSSEQDLV